MYVMNAIHYLWGPRDTKTGHCNLVIQGLIPSLETWVVVKELGGYYRKTGGQARDLGGYKCDRWVAK